MPQPFRPLVEATKVVVYQMISERPDVLHQGVFHFREKTQEICVFPLHIPEALFYTPSHQVTDSAVVAELVDAQR